METVEVFGLKGGVGCSTVAAAAAALLHGAGRRVTLYDGDGCGATAALGGPPARLGDSPGRWAVELEPANGAEAVGTAAVYDRGTVSVENMPQFCGVRLLVVTSCYLGLRRSTPLDLAAFDGLVWVREPGRGINRQWVETVTGRPILATVDHDAAVARTVDAGLLLLRMPAGLRVLADPLGPPVEAVTVR